nr:uncharacterized protein LOC127318128 [Lolium perenne]
MILTGSPLSDLPVDGNLFFFSGLNPKDRAAAVGGNQTPHIGETRAIIDHGVPPQCYLADGVGSPTWLPRCRPICGAREKLRRPSVLALVARAEDGFNGGRGGNRSTSSAGPGGDGGGGNTSAPTWGADAGGVAKSAVVCLAAAVVGERSADIPEHGLPARVRTRQRVPRLDGRPQPVLLLPARRHRALRVLLGLPAPHRALNL